MQKNIQIAVISPPDREKLAVELCFENEQVAELNQEENDLSIELYGRQDGRPWIIPYDEFVRALQNAKKELVG